MHPATDLQLQQMNNFNNTEDYYSSFHYNDNNEAQIFEHNNQTVNLLHTIFGTFGFIANFLWVLFLLLKKQKKRISIYFACYGLISSIISIAYIFEYSRKIYYKDDPRIVRPLDCSFGHVR
ncbi:G-protein coupled receptor [Trichinella pseudospiralis]